MDVKHWSTSSFLERSEDCPTALIILNTPLANDALFKQIWAASSIRYCADGGANRLYDRFVKPGNALRGVGGALEHCAAADYLPDLIKGDFDSLKPHVKEYYESRGVPIVHDPDQYSTDLGKCIASLVEEEERLKTSDSRPVEHQLVISGGLSGRLDQTVHTIHALMQLARVRRRTWAVGADSIACVLGKGKHELNISLDHFGNTCGILPFGEPAHVTTEGLEWDLGPGSHAFPTSVAEGVSTSNHLSREDVTIETDRPIVWTVEVKGCE